MYFDREKFRRVIIMFYYHPYEPTSQLRGVLMSPLDWDKKVDFFFEISMAPPLMNMKPLTFLTIYSPISNNKDL